MFIWHTYPSEKKEISYLKDFTSKNPDINFHLLDLAELEDCSIVPIPHQFNSVAQDQSNRISRFGGLELKEKIAKKTGAINKDKYRDRDNDFYDLEDKWIDDGEEEEDGKGKMAIPEVFYSDFYCNKGDPKDLLESSGYKDRKKLVEGFTLELEEEEKLLTIKEKKNKKNKIKPLPKSLHLFPKEKKKKKEKFVKPESIDASVLPHLGVDVLKNIPFLQNLINNYSNYHSIIFGSAINASSLEGSNQEMIEEGEPKKKLKKDNIPEIIEIIENEDEN